MKAFEYDGKIYRSMAEFCRKNKISYEKLKRLCRHYRKAVGSPQIAINWIIKKEIYCLETKTHKYYQDLEKTVIRQDRAKDKRDKLALEFLEQNKKINS